MNPALTLLGEIVAYGGGAAAISYLLFQFLGKSWIEAKFAQQLQQSQHDHALELQRLRVKIDSLLSGTLKLQDKEFEILPNIWTSLDDVFEVLRWVSSPLQQFPDLDRMSDRQLEEFLEGTELTPSQKDDIRQAQRQRVMTYKKIVFWHRLHKTKTTFGEYQALVARNSIFLESEFHEKLMQLESLLWDAIITPEVGEESEDFKMRNGAWKKVKDEGEPIRRELGAYIQKRLLRGLVWVPMGGFIAVRPYNSSVFAF